jgi:AraC-like DNA-binding protein
MSESPYPVLQGNTLFRKNELVYINKSSELEEYMNVMHKHDFIEIAYVLDGKGKHAVGNNQYEIYKGDLFIINYDVPHGFFAMDDKSDIPVVYNCVFMPEFLDNSLFRSMNINDIASSFLFKSLFPDDSNTLPDLKLQGTDYIEIGDIFNKMYLEYKSMKQGYPDIIRAYLIELLIKIIRYMYMYNYKTVSAKNFELITKAVDYLKQNYNTEIRLEDIAVKSFTSKNYLSKLFKEVTGMNFSEYIHKIRINEACSLLRSTDQSVSSIAEQVGFNDMKFFYEIFRRITGTTPGKYRKL